MRKRERVEHEFVEFIPQRLEQGSVYISIEYATCSHLCLCGCGKKVVTPLAPMEWKLIFDGETISLSPSIGNWSFDCQSHYWIKESRVIWGRAWSKQKIEANRAHDRRRKQRHFGDVENEATYVQQTNAQKPNEPGWLQLVFGRLRRRCQ